MSALSQEPGEHVARIRVVVDQQEMQPSRSCDLPICSLRRCNQRFAHKFEKHSKRRAPVFPLALYSDRAAVEIEQSFRNGQAEAQSPKLSGNGRLALIKSLEDATLLFRLNANAGIADF